MSNPRTNSKTNVTIAAVHKSPFNDITQPGHYAALSHYFIDNWLPQISANGLKMLMALRKLGYHNPQTGEKRGAVDIDQDVLAARAGISVKTVQRIFADDPVFCKYVQRVFQIDRDRTGRILREHYIYVVVMDDVLTPEDEARLAAMQQGLDKNLGQEKGQEGLDKNLGLGKQNQPMRQNVASADLPMRQNVVWAGQSDAPIRHSDASARQNVASLNRSLNTLHTSNTSDTPAAPGVSTSSVSDPDFPEKIEEEPPEQKPLPFTSLSASEQAPWLDAAEQELRHSFGLEAWLKTGEKARAGIRKQRAASLYNSSQKE